MHTTICRECGDPSETHRHDKRFCSRLCHDRFKARKARRAAKVYDLLIKWRVTRGARKGTLGEIAHVVDGWIKEDMERKRG